MAMKPRKKKPVRKMRGGGMVKKGPKKICY